MNAINNVAACAQSMRAESKYRPILFSDPMVRALLDGSKTQTRRVVKLPIQEHEKWAHGAALQNRGEWYSIAGAANFSPYGQPGDLLWVRETHIAFDVGRVHYRADSTSDPKGDREYGVTWTPSIHMPRWASRITLEITGVRVERLQDISEADAKAEGAQPNDGYAGPACDRVKGWRKGYMQLWKKINGPDSWDANPWVWVIEFRRMEGGAA